MANNIYVLEAVNLLVSNIAATSNASQSIYSQHLTLSELKLPGLEIAYVNHQPGGAWLGIEVDVNMTRLEATFNLAGIQTEVMSLLNRQLNTFTAFGAVRSRADGSIQQAKAIMTGQLGRVNPQNFRRGDLLHHEYSIRGLVHYEFYIGEQSAPEEIYFWDFFTNTFRIAGVDTNADVNAAIGLTGVTGIGATA